MLGLSVDQVNTIFTNGLNERNCNGRLSSLYKMRDRQSATISRMAASGVDCSSAEYAYDNICDTIDELLEFRRHHDCLLEGDYGYMPY